MSTPFLLAVYGQPAPQGSKRHVGKGRMLESSAAVKPWREAVKFAALDALQHDDGWVPLDEPLRLDVVFSFNRPKSHYGTGRNAGTVKRSAPSHPTGMPDLSKLIRSTEDALTDAGVWRDDSRVTAVFATKAYVLTGPDTLSTPGAIIRVWRQTAALSEETES